MEQYINQNLKDSIESLNVCQGVGKDSGNPYYYIEIVFVNGFKKRLFLNDAEQFAVCNAFICVDDLKD